MTGPFAETFVLAVPPRHPLRPALERTLATLEGLHRFPLILPMGVRTEPIVGSSGLFDPTRPFLGVRVSDEAEQPGLTLLHEIAHALDHAAYGAGRGWASGGAHRTPRQQAAWHAWHTALSATETARTLHALAHGAELAPFPAQRRLAAYLLDPKELFARAYAQFVAVETGDAALGAELQVLRARRWPAFQWKAEEFATLVPLTRALLRAYGGGS